MSNDDAVCEICNSSATVQLLDRHDASKHSFCSDHKNKFLLPPGTSNPRFTIERFHLPPGNMLSQHLAAPATSPEHKAFRHEMCVCGLLAGDGACRYYLSVLMNTDQFAAWSDDFQRSIQQYVAKATSPEAGELCHDPQCLSAIAGFFRLVMERLEGKYDGHTRREDLAIETLLLHPNWTDREVAKSVPTTLKQLERFSNYKLLRTLQKRSISR